MYFKHILSKFLTKYLKLLIEILGEAVRIIRIIKILIDFTAAGVVPCGGRKTSSRTSTIEQLIFYFGPLRSAIIF